MIINNVELDFDVFDVNTLVRYEAASDKLDAAIKESGRKALEKQITPAASARITCKAVKTFFDEVFGGSAGEEICGKEDHLKRCLEAYRALLNEEARQAEEQNKLNADILRLRGLTDEQIKLNSQKTAEVLRGQDNVSESLIGRQKIEEIIQDVTSPTGSVAPKFRKLPDSAEE